MTDTPKNTPPQQTPMDTDPPPVSGTNPPSQQQTRQYETPPRNHFSDQDNLTFTPSSIDNVSSAHTADVPFGGEEGGSYSGPLCISNIISLTSRPENTLAPPHDAKEAYKRDLEAFPGDLQNTGIKLECPIPQLDIARRTALDHQWVLEDRALQVDLHESPELDAEVVMELVEDIIHLDDDATELPSRTVDYINGGPGVRVGFLCASASQRDRVAIALKKALERRAVEHTLFPLDNKQRESILEAARTIRCHFEPHNQESIGGFVSLVPGVDLAGLVKDNQHLDVQPGEGPRNVIASVETSTAEATEALKGITLATPGRKSSNEIAAGSATGGGKGGKKKFSGKAAEQRKLKKIKKHKSKQL